tara:strand:+ start:131 stop:385 length:255 start_codon:yes stop_codon:yes gene_type:complete
VILQPLTNPPIISLRLSRLAFARSLIEFANDVVEKYKTKKTPIRVIEKPIENKFKDGAERVIIPILTLVNNKTTENGSIMIEAA